MLVYYIKYNLYLSYIFFKVEFLKIPSITVIKNKNYPLVQAIARVMT